MSVLPVSVTRLVFEGPHVAQRGAIAALLERKRLESPAVTVSVVEVSGVFSVVIRGGDSGCVGLVAEAARRVANASRCVGVAA